MYRHTRRDILTKEPALSHPLRLYVDAEYISPYALSVFVTLTEKQLPFEVETVELRTQAQHTPTYAALSLTQRIPTLVHGDFALSESSAIEEYLDETFPQHPVYPQDCQARAQARQVQAWLRGDLLALRAERSTQAIFLGDPVNPTMSAPAQLAAQKLITAASTLLRHGGEHLFGQWCIADTDLALALNRLIFSHDPVPEALVRYARAQWTRPSVQAWLARVPQAS